MRKALVLGLGLLAASGTIAYTQNLEAIQTRREAMRSIARSGTPPFQMLRGNAPFDLARVKAGLQTFQQEGAKLRNLFPDDSKTGGNTDASPKIWTARSDFDRAIDTFIGIARNAEEKITDESTFKAEYPQVAASCGGCHKDAEGFSPRLSDSIKKMQEQK